MGNTQVAIYTLLQTCPAVSVSARQVKPACREQVAPVHTDTTVFTKTAMPTVRLSQRGPLHGKVGTRASVSSAPRVCGESKAPSLGRLHASGAHTHCDVQAW